MHPSAYNTGKLFFDVYSQHNNKEKVNVVEIGSQDLNGSLRDFQNERIYQYIGMDLCPGKGVDIVLETPYKFPFQDNTFDILVSSSCFEHSEMFWITFLECLRILKPNGIFYANVPSTWMKFHRFPVDCWRFYPDAGKALETWARWNHLNTKVLESYICPPGLYESVCDWVGVFLKDEKFISEYPIRMLDSLTPYKDYFNAYRFPGDSNGFSGTWEELSSPFDHSINLKRKDSHNIEIVFNDNNKKVN